MRAERVAGPCPRPGEVWFAAPISLRAEVAAFASGNGLAPGPIRTSSILIPSGPCKNKLREHLVPDGVWMLTKPHWDALEAWLGADGAVERPVVARQDGAFVELLPPEFILRAFSPSLLRSPPDPATGEQLAAHPELTGAPLPASGSVAPLPADVCSVISMPSKAATAELARRALVDAAAGASASPGAIVLILDLGGAGWRQLAAEPAGQTLEGARLRRALATPEGAAAVERLALRVSANWPAPGGAAPRGSAVRGLMNLGNTCFFNSAVQCLLATQPLVRYLLEQRHHLETNIDNPLGQGGALAATFAALAQDVWDGMGLLDGPPDAGDAQVPGEAGAISEPGGAAGGTGPSSGVLGERTSGRPARPPQAPHQRALVPSVLKAVIARFAPQFAGFGQQDSQELTAFLLDGIHEDLNRVLEKPPTEAPTGDDSADDAELATRSWETHLRRNQSVIVDLFQGQLRSRLECPSCGQVSVTSRVFLFHFVIVVVIVVITSIASLGAILGARAVPVRGRFAGTQGRAAHRWKGDAGIGYRRLSASSW
ncbi:hypothetical protein FNF27_07381 [Cafeteria roenbergensis]|uniref:USP domain-containing protein n=1 Tax=Cafeteria roenbergensis TaxID=33653 RepID=A0A5A8DNQ9_CAFRO|nr:hypothetical protein FNF27_07381 [Cafeteria roenbergensis]